MTHFLAAVGAVVAVLLTLGGALAQPADTTPLIDMSDILGPADSTAEETVAARAESATPQQLPAPLGLLTPRLDDGESALVDLSNDGVLRLSGEQVVARLVLDLPSVIEDTPFRLTYRNSIDVLPEASRMRVVINGSEAAVLPMDVFGTFQSVDVPAPVLFPGRNEVVIEAVHSHRIFCGIEASFQIWTEIDLTRSGISLPPTLARSDLAGVLTSLRLAGADGSPVVVRAAPGANRAVAQVFSERFGGLIGGRSVQIGSPWDPAPEGPASPRVVLEPGVSASVDVMTGADGAQVLRVTHGPVDPLDPGAALPDLSAQAQGGSSFLEPAAGVALLAPGTQIPIGDLGFTQRAEVASYVLQSVSFRLPPDWLSLSSQKGHLYLDYSFPPGLPSGAILLVKANETTIRELPLDRDGGKDLPTLDVGFLLSDLGPGINRINFEAILEAENPLLPCPPWPQSVLTVEPTSLLLVPEMPSMYFDGIERGLPAVSASGLTYNGRDGGRSRRIDGAVQREIAAAFGAAGGVPTGTADNAELNILLADEFVTATAGDLTLSRQRVSTVLQVPSGTGETGADDERGVLSQIVSVPASAATWITSLALPGGPPLDSWLQNRSADAMLLQPEASRPDRLVLILGQGVDPGDIARKIVADRLDQNGPRGRVALLTAAGAWEIWRPPFDPPRLSGSITLGNMRAVLGNYASWSPIGFAVFLFALTMVSAFIAIIYLRRTRDERY